MATTTTDIYKQLTDALWTQANAQLPVIDHNHQSLQCRIACEVMVDGKQVYVHGTENPGDWGHRCTLRNLSYLLRELIGNLRWIGHDLIESQRTEVKIVVTPIRHATLVIPEPMTFAASWEAPADNRTTDATAARKYAPDCYTVCNWLMDEIMAGRISEEDTVGQLVDQLAKMARTEIEVSP